VSVQTQKQFSYSVRTSAGELLEGKIEAPNEAAVANRLRSMGYTPIEIKERKTTGLQAEIKIPGLSDRITLKDLAIMSRQFATMISAGLSLLRSLTILAEQTENKALAKVLAAVRNDVETGLSLSAALAKHDQVFPPLMINMVRAGEVGGFLDGVLISVAENMEAEVKLRSTIKSAMAYPVAVLVIAILAVVGMLLFIVPIFEEMFNSLGGDLPAPTQILVVLAEIMKWAIVPLIIVTIVGVIMWQRYKNERSVREFKDPLILKMPIFGPLFQKVAIARFTRNFSTMIAAGVPLLQALDIVADTAGNIVIENAIHDVQDSVRRGTSLAAPLANHPVFPPMVVQMMAVGEDTGALDAMLDKVADFYDDEVTATTEQLTSLIEPLMILFIGGIVGSMIIALYMPIFSVFDLIE